MEDSVRRPHKKHRRAKSGLKLVLRDVILLVVSLNVFALFHHVIPRPMTPAGTTAAYGQALSVTPAPAAAEPTIAESLVSNVSLEFPPSPTPVLGDFSATFPTGDMDAGALYSYQSDAARVSIQRIQADGVTFFLADVYVKSIEALQTAFAKGSYGRSIYEFPAKTANSNGAVFAVTGDYYSARSKGIVVRNGELYRDVPGGDVCVLFRNGEMKTYTGEVPDLAGTEAQSIWQAWSFGPALLTGDGGAITEFTSDLNDRHPRCGIGYYAPGHYCFIVVDGRQKGYSVGVRLSEFSQMFERLGCKQAYNLDGGATAIMMFRGEVINQPYKGGRESGDIIYFK